MAKRSKHPGATRNDIPPPASAPGKPHPRSIFQARLADIGLPLLLAAVAFLAYWPSLKSDFVYDARMEILEEGFITSLSNLPDILSLKVLGMNLILADRPGQLLYLMLNAAVWGKEPWGYHLCSNLLHAANVALLFVLLRRLIATEIIGGSVALKARLAAVAVTLIFALHPIAVEPVAGVSFSSDLLVTFFTLLALLAAMAFRSDNLRLALLTGGAAVFCSLAAVMCKESGLAAALLLIVYWFLFRRAEAGGPWLLFLGAAMAVTVVFLAARFLFAPPGQVPSDYLGGSFFQVFLIQPRLWVFMMGKLLWPAQFSADYTLENVNGLPTHLALTILIVVVLLQACLASQSRIGALGVAVYWLGLATVSNFIPLYRMMADRFYYLPLAGVAMQLLAVLLVTLKSREGFWIATAALVASLPLLTFLTLTREAAFASDQLLWSDTLQVSPFSATAHDNLGYVYLKDGKLDEAMGHIERALEIAPRYAPAYNNLGYALLQRGQTDEAMVLLQKGLELDPTYAGTYNNLGIALSQKGRVDDAIVQYEKALEINPNHAEARNNLGVALFKKGRVDEAMDQFQKALEISPDSADAHNNLANVLLQKKQTDEAIAQYQMALEINPDYADAHHNLGVAFSRKGRLDEAITQFQQALEINPNYAQAHNDLGTAFLQKGEVDEAIAQFQAILQLNPRDRNAQDNLAQALARARQGAPRK